MNIRIQILSLMLLLLSINTVNAQGFQYTENQPKQVSRYVSLMPKATEAQRNPMKTVIPYVNFRHNVKTVGQAIQSVLKDTGYRVARFHPDKRVLKMFSHRLPKIHRNMGPLTLEQTLETLSGEPWILAVDPINRLVSFQLPKSYKAVSLKKMGTPKPAYKMPKKEALQKIKKQYNYYAKPRKKAIAKRKVVKRKYVGSKKVKVTKISPKNDHGIDWSKLPAVLR